MIHTAKVLVFDPVKKAAVSVEVVIDLNLPRLAQTMAQKAIRNKSRKATAAGQCAKARLTGMDA